MAKKVKKRKLRLGAVLVIVLVLALLVGGGGFFYYNSNLQAPQKDSEYVTVNIESGSSFSSAMSTLEEAGIIKNAFIAKVYAKNNDLTSVKSGEYEIDKSWDLATVLAYVNDASNTIQNTDRVTIVEGDWAKDIARKISAKTNVSAEELLSMWNDPSYVRSLMSDYPFLTEELFNDNVRILLEGYLAPNTYEFFAETSGDEVTRKILDQTLAVYNQYADLIAKSNLSIHQLYTLASIVQYESGTEEDMKMIAGVFYNRLAIDMPLQSSVTVCYAIDKEQDDDWQKCEVSADRLDYNPYNTYQNAGLPPGAILNPGVKAIEAVLNPTESNYYYFMADVYGDGSVYYAETLAEHEANCAKYLH